MSYDALPDQEQSAKFALKQPKSTRRRSFAEWCTLLALGVTRLWARRPPFLQALTVARKGGTELVVLGAIVALVVVTWEATFESLIVVEPISIPKSLEAEGYTSTIIAQRLIDEVQAIGDASGSKKKRTAIGSESAFAALSTIQVPAAGFSFRSLIATLRDLFNVPESRIGGEVLIKHKADGIGPMRYVLMLRLDGSEGRYVRMIDEEDIDKTIISAAHVVVERVDPSILAAYFFKFDKWEATEEMAERVSMTTDKDTAKWAVIIRGDLRVKTGQYDEAISFYRQAIELDRQFVVAYVNWANALVLKREYAVAVDKLETALKIDPHFSRAHVIWGDALNEQKHYDEAIDQYQEASRLDPRDELPLVNWAYVLNTKREFSKALDKCHEAVVANPMEPSPYNVCGIIYTNISDLKSATLMFQKAIEVKPDFAGAQKNWGDVLKAMQNYEGAIEKYSKACNSQPTYADAKVAWAEALATMQRFDEAIA